MGDAYGHITNADYVTLRTVVDLVPRYAHARRRGWTPTFGGHAELTLPRYILLRRIASVLDDRPCTPTELDNHLSDPYSTDDEALDDISTLVATGYIDRSDDGYTLSCIGGEILMHNERAANDYAASHIRMKPSDLERLAATLHDVTERQRLAPEPLDKEHQDRVPRLRRFDPRPIPAVQLEYAMYALQRARDDAHIAAWRSYGCTGPQIVLLSYLWAEGETTASKLGEQSRERIGSEFVQAILETLARNDFVAIDHQSVSMTPQGQSIRDAIERETDRVYFTPWPRIDGTWVCDQLEALALSFAR